MTRNLLILGVWLVSATAQAQTLSVDIEQPTGGIVHGPLVTLSATVSDPRVLHATLVANGASYDVPVEQGRVEQQIIAIPGNNRLAVTVQHGSHTARDSLTFLYDGPAMELAVILGWPSEGEIIDLWVREPGGETCKWDHRRTESGGRLLDFSTNAIGFGSQGYTLPEVHAGTYRVKIHYWGAFSAEDDRSLHTLDTLLSQLDTAERSLASASGVERNRLAGEAQRLRDRIDAWSVPAAPQTPVHAEIVLFPGTQFERRWRFDRVVQRTGELLTLGQIEISESMIRAARGERP